MQLVQYGYILMASNIARLLLSERSRISAVLRKSIVNTTLDEV